jgi:hypothetical protein
MRQVYQFFGLLALALLGLSLVVLVHSFHAGFGWGTVAALVFVLRIFPWPRRKRLSIWDLL